jgi:hypothetical protein
VVEFSALERCDGEYAKTVLHGGTVKWNQTYGSSHERRRHDCIS